MILPLPFDTMHSPFEVTLCGDGTRRSKTTRPLTMAGVVVSGVPIASECCHPVVKKAWKGRDFSAPTRHLSSPREGVLLPESRGLDVPLGGVYKYGAGLRKPAWRTKVVQTPGPEVSPRSGVLVSTALPVPLSVWFGSMWGFVSEGEDCGHVALLFEKAGGARF